jgi:hypothetical protein
MYAHFHHIDHFGSYCVLLVGYRSTTYCSIDGSIDDSHYFFVFGFVSPDFVAFTDVVLVVATFVVFLSLHSRTFLLVSLGICLLLVEFRLFFGFSRFFVIIGFFIHCFLLFPYIVLMSLILDETGLHCMHIVLLVCNKKSLVGNH